MPCSVRTTAPRASRPDRYFAYSSAHFVHSATAITPRDPSAPAMENESWERCSLCRVSTYGATIPALFLTQVLV